MKRQFRVFFIILVRIRIPTRGIISLNILYILYRGYLNVKQYFSNIYILLKSLGLMNEIVLERFHFSVFGYDNFFVCNYVICMYLWGATAAAAEP